MTRKEAIEILKAYRSKLSNSVSNQLDGDIKAFDIAINSLEIDERYELEYEQIEPCDDAISREPFTNSTICEGFSCEECSFNRKDKGGCILEERVMKLPPVTPQPKMGRWINQRVIYTNATIDFKVCSECRYEFSYDAETGVCDANYCPNCGARMESEDKE